MELRWTETARADLAALQQDLQALSPEAADQLPGRLLHRTRALTEYPRMGRTIPEFENPLLRELIEGGYRILYEVFPDRVEVCGALPMAGNRSSSRPDRTKANRRSPTPALSF